MDSRHIFHSALNKTVCVKDSLISTRTKEEEIFKILERSYSKAVIVLPENILAEFTEATKFTPGNVRQVLKVQKDLTLEENKLLLSYVISDSSENLVRK